MIVTRQETGLRIVTQPDHARVAAEMLSLWRGDGLPEHPRRDDLLLAVREHDNGWRETDAAPRVDPETGAPYGFLDLPDEPRRELWLRGALRYADERPGAAALITRHGIGLHEDRRAARAWTEFFTTLEERLEELLERAGYDAADLESDYRWLRLADALSLDACGALGGGSGTETTRVERRDLDLTLDPFPLAGATTFDIPCRHIPNRRYDSDTDLAVEMASARWTRFQVRLTPASS